MTFGFPPIKYFEDKKDKKITKERSFIHNKTKDFNIRKILSDNKKVPIVIVDQLPNKDDMEIVSTL